MTWRGSPDAGDDERAGAADHIRPRDGRGECGHNQAGGARRKRFGWRFRIGIWRIRKIGSWRFRKKYKPPDRRS
eukprot:9500856-Pyramimonas_sp.AAC.2